jgi:nucleoside-diphosphate-sugar epimerase
MKTVLVMGGATFVSKSLVKYLIQQGYRVDILTRGQKEIDYTGLEEHLICDRKSIADMQKKFDGKEYEYVFDISAYTKEDVEILLSSINKSILKKYIFCSSGAVYKPSNEIINEGFETGDNHNWGKYGSDKKAAEDIIINSGVPYAIFRPTYIYGENNNLYREAYFFDSISSDRAIPMPYGSNTRTQFIHIDDLVKVFESAIESTNLSGIYNVTNPDIITWEGYIEKCGIAVGKNPIIKKNDVHESKLESRAYFPFRDVTYMLDIKHLIEDKLYVPTISLEEGLKQTYQWYLDVKPSVWDEKMMGVVNEMVMVE